MTAEHKGPLRIQMSFLPQSMQAARRLIALAEVSADDEAVLSAAAILFLQTTVEIFVDNIAWFTMEASEYTEFQNRSLRDRLRALDARMPAPFLGRRENAQDGFQLDRLLTLRSKIVHGRGMNIRLERRVVDNREVLIDLDTGQDVSSKKPQEIFNRVWYARLSAVDAKEIERAVTNFLTTHTPDALG